MQILTEGYWPDWMATLDDGKQPEAEERGYGIAVDLGTTTMVVYLEDLAHQKNLGIRSLMNPQGSFGADVISRILFAREESDGLNRLRSLVRDSMEETIIQLCRSHRINPSEIHRIAIAGNTTMLHIFRGTDPSPLAVYPFSAPFLEKQELSCAEAGWVELTSAPTTLLPGISAYVGADIVAGMASVDWPEDGTHALFLDIGTNGEMAIGNHRRIIACSTAAGPAFEGARISCGVGGIEGAVSHYSSEGYETIGSKAPIGLCGSGLIDAVAVLLEKGTIDLMGFMEQDHLLIKSNRDHPAILLTPQDVREVQLAKGAIAAGIEVLMQKAGITDPGNQISRVYLAGGFGHALHEATALRIGLIPEELAGKVIRAGNTSGTGARLWLHTNTFRERVEQILHRTEYFELSGIGLFNTLFVERMIF